MRLRSLFLPKNRPLRVLPLALRDSLSESEEELDLLPKNPLRLPVLFCGLVGGGEVLLENMLRLRPGDWLESFSS